MEGIELRERREALGMTQERLAAALNVAANTVARWERDERAIPPHLSLALDTVEREHGRPPKPKVAATNGQAMPKKRAVKKGGRK
jgi:DNA-binding transcriptional regulator YiaG